MDNNWELTGPKIADCLENHLRAEELKRQMELAYQERVKLLGEIEEIVRNSAALLKGIYRNTPTKLTDWGFEVIETATVKKPPTP